MDAAVSYTAKLRNVNTGVVVKMNCPSTWKFSGDRATDDNRRG
jgi:hypothetical protein